jgi:hypothetical protein
MDRRAGARGGVRGEVIAVRVAGRDIAIYECEGQVYASDNLCTHGAARLSEGFLEGREIECPLQSGAFRHLQRPRPQRHSRRTAGTTGARRRHTGAAAPGLSAGSLKRPAAARPGPARPGQQQAQVCQKRTGWRSIRAAGRARPGSAAGWRRSCTNSDSASWRRAAAAAARRSTASSQAGRSGGARAAARSAAAQVGRAAQPRHPQAVGQLAAEHLVGQHGQREQLGALLPALPTKYSGRCTAACRPGPRARRLVCASAARPHARSRSR